ncbi:hypothetical protein CC86DRAFT_40346 [Ophiobolus disseminans]|uniref:Zn(2)-C6 fungal-type domain-containing protein n=1 Tax=Ophiobolus disseminans TaxID=1469910 RepID=A0A6A6ZXI2_9PLEO|nr:hypothetical protein CC86DRAFT_40346 [Ophiobolus disseminans]
MEYTERWQPIAPASDEPGQQRPTSDPKKRRQAVAVACLQCRSGKAKCDGARPQCTRCSELELRCQYDVAEGVSRAERMKMLKRDDMSSRAEETERVLRALRTSSDVQAANLLARLRIGERVEDLAKDLPSTLAYPVVTRPTNLLAQDPAGGGASTDSRAAFGDSISSPYRNPPRASFSPAPGKPSPGWSGFLPTTPPGQHPSAKGKQSVPTISLAQSSFLSLLYDREDFLQITNESEDEMDTDEITEGVIDPRLLSSSSAFNVASASIGSPMETSSPKKEHFAKTHGFSHLSNRQQAVNTIRIHPNISLRNLFGNMPFSSSVRTNNYPSEIQDQQVNNLFIPTWAMMSVNTRPDPGSLRDAFQSMKQEATTMMENGTPVQLIIETHPNIAALFDENKYNSSGVLSKWAAGMAYSARLKSNDFTSFASMYVFWWLMRWMISPSPETYESMPQWLRPTPNQLFMPHITIVDFITWPALRETVVQIPEMQERMEWMLDLCNHIQCDWYFSSEEALQMNEDTGHIDLCDLAKTTIKDLTSWSIGPSFRQYVTNADSYVRIRTEDY